MTPVVEGRHVTFGYRTGQPVLREVSFAWMPGRRVTILGANGAGKSTLLHLMNGTHRPEAGSLRLDGRPFGYGRSELNALRRSVALVVQNPDDQVLAPIAIEDVAIGALGLGLPHDEARERAMAALDAVGLGGAADLPVDELSFGQRKLLALAGAIVVSPRVLLLDEPTASLDSAGVTRLAAVLNELARSGAAVVITTHDTDFAWEWADEVLLLARGTVIAAGPTRQVLSHSAHVADATLRTPFVCRVWDALPEPVRTDLDPPRTCEGLAMAIGSLVPWGSL